MKKIYFLLFTCIATVTYGQELFVNGDFESWDDANTPNGFTLYESVDQESVELHGGSYSVKHTGGRSDLGQLITGIIPGKPYTLSLWYKVEAGSGDDSDARIWSKWSTDGTNDNNTDKDVLQGPNDAYLDNNGNAWTEYTVTVTAPETANEFYFEVRTYSSAIVYWDDFSFFQEQETEDSPELIITSPSSDGIIPDFDVYLDFSVKNFTIGTSGTDGVDGHVKYTIDGTESKMLYNTDPVKITGLYTEQHIIKVQLVDNNGAALSPDVTETIVFEVIVPVEVADLLALRESLDGGIYEIQSHPTITYIDGDQIYIQDASNKAILVDNSSGVITTEFSTGDGMEGLVGEISCCSSDKFVTLFFPYADASVTTGTTITPTVITVLELITEYIEYDSQLIQINNTTFADAGDTFVINTDYTITDSSNDTNTLSMLFTPFSGADYIGQTIPSGTTPLVALVVGKSDFDTPIVSARSLNDFTLSSSSYELADFKVHPNPTSTGLVNISSKTNDAINVTVFDILGKQIINNTVTNNTLNVSALNNGIYIMKISQNGNTITKKLVIK